VNQAVYIPVHRWTGCRPGRCRSRQARGRWRQPGSGVHRQPLRL